MVRPQAAPRGALVLMLARTRVPLERPLPVENYQHPAQNDHWKDFLATMENARGCEHVACSRVAEDPEKVLFVTTWHDQSCLNEFRASPDYVVFLMGLGILDVASESSSTPPSSSSTSSSLPSTQVIKFLGPNATNGLFLRGWLSWYTVALPIDNRGADVDAGRDELLQRLRGPRYPSLEERGGRTNAEWHIRLINLPRAVRSHGLQYGWVQDTRTIKVACNGADDEGVEGEGGNGQARETARTVEIKVQEGVIYRMWQSREAEEALKAAIPEVDMNECWERDLRQVGAVGGWEEHVMLVRVTRGRSHRAG